MVSITSECGVDKSEQAEETQSEAFKATRTDEMKWDLVPALVSAVSFGVFMLTFVGRDVRR